MAGTDVNEIYDRLQSRFDLEDLDDDAIEGALLENFTNRKTKHTGNVDLTSDHVIKELTGDGKKLRERKIKGFTPRLRGVVDGIKKLRDKDIDVEINKIISKKPFSIASVERGDAESILEEREKQLNKWRNVREDVDDLIRDNVEVYREELERSIREQEEEKARIAREEREEIRAAAQQLRASRDLEEAERLEEELSQTSKGRQTLGGIRSGERRRVPGAMRSIFELEV